MSIQGFRTWNLLTLIGSWKKTYVNGKGGKKSIWYMNWIDIVKLFIFAVITSVDI